MYLTKDVVLDYLTQERIFQHYMNSYIDINVLHKNPLRPDNHPRCQFKYGENGVLYFMDYSPKSRMSVDCFGYVMKLYNVDFLDALRIIARDFDLESIYNGTKKRPDWMNIVNNSRDNTIMLSETKYDFTVRDWTIPPMRFWRTALPELKTKFLIDNGIYLIDELFINDSRVRDEKLIFLYKLKDDFTHYQLYKPSKFIKGNKHISVTDRSLFFTEKLNRKLNYAVIIKSVKDYVCGKAMELNSACVLSENLLTHKTDIELMKNLTEEFDYVFTLFDNDRAGKLASLQYKKEYGTIPLIFPKDMKKDMYENLVVGNRSKIEYNIEWLKRRYNI